MSGGKKKKNRKKERQKGSRKAERDTKVESTEFLQKKGIQP